MKIKICLMCFLLIFVPIAAIAVNGTVYQDKPTEDAANLVAKYTLSDDADKKGYVKQLEDMTIKYPNNINVRNMYANILIADKKYSLGLEQLKIVNNVNPEPVSKLTECMLVERNGKEVASCYKEAVSLFEKKHEDDDNYIIALYLAGDSRFEVARNKLVSSGKLTETEKNILSMSRNELIGTFFP
ncbi:hypothetical protein OCJ35_02935 [Pluralibacter gergoviae]|uniref:hypothetical protein n=1 Tax=Pluralibacter gergoviae TaxID=61647 RepID=UPI000FDAD300|nr:hypothetical protein [Pluralibacter gergoviae]MCK1069424.1 hypothetical protein [Pluralibacter gergoviae]MCV7757088.1 hypothetical protein [Pluralibacter gergoviae]